MSRSVLPLRLFRAAVAAAVLGGILYFQEQIAFGHIMGGVMSMNAQRTERDGDEATRKWSLDQAVRWSPRDYHALYRLGSYHIERREDAAALEVFERCEAISPDHLGTLLALADIHTRANDLERSAEYVNRAREVAPTSWRAYLAAGTLAGKLGMHEKAIELLEKSDRFARRPQVGVYNQMAVAQLLAGNPEVSFDYAEKSVAIKRHNPEGWLINGKARLVLGRFEEAVVPLRRAVDQTDEDNAVQLSDAYLHLAGALGQTGELVEATTILRDEVGRSSDIAQARATIANLIETLEAVAAGERAQAEALCNLGMALLATGDAEAAERHFLLARKAPGTLDAACTWAHAEAAMRLGKETESTALYEEAIAKGDPPRELRLGFAEALAKTGRTGEARLQYMLVLQAFNLPPEEYSRVHALMQALP